MGELQRGSSSYGERVARSARGRYRDILYGPDGRILEERPWRSNLIVNTLPVVLACMVRGEEGRRMDTWAVGTGSESWDDHTDSAPTLPVDSEREARESLYYESARIKLNIADVTLLSPGQLKIEASFTMADFAAVSGDPARLRLREFSLIIGGGDTKGMGNSECDPQKEFLVNHVIHPRIDMQEGLTLRRSLILTF